MGRAAVIFVAIATASCGEAGSLRTVEQPIRPTEADAALGISYGDATVESHASAGGSFRVWWAADGPHAAPLADSSPQNGVPDFVETVATTADAVVELLEGEGWRIALPDGSATAPDGGDDRFDIYLVDFGGSSDGTVVKNTCSGGTCTAHMLIENDFSRSSYASDEEAITVLVSHEYFHAVQAAYAEELDPWLSEGTATWFEEYFEPSQRDFERLANLYLAETDRSLDDRSQGPFDGFSYGAALLIHYIELTVGAAAVRGTLEALIDGTEGVDALALGLAGEGADLADVFGGFAVWNAFTGSRATDGGYPAAADYDVVPLMALDASAGANWDVSVDALASRYGRLSLSGGARLSVAAIDGFEAPRVYVARSPTEYDELDAEGVFVTDDEAIVVVANGDPNAQRAVRVQVRNESTPVDDENNATANNATSNNGEGPMVVLEPEDEGGCRTAATSPDRVALLIVLGAFWSRARRRRERSDENLRRQW